MRPNLSDSSAFAASPEPPSKSSRKRAMHALQDLGQALVELPPSHRDRLQLPTALADAVQQYLHTRSHEGRRRQMQYIGKLMRQVDPEPIAQAVAAAKLGHAADRLALHRAEYWRDALIGADAALDQWLIEYPGSDVQQLRSLIRAARKAAPADHPAGAPPRAGKAYRDLFQWLRTCIDQAATPPQEQAP